MSDSDANPTPEAGETPIDEYLEEFYDAKAKQISYNGDEKARSGTYVHDLQRVLPDWIDWMESRGYRTLNDLDGGAIRRWAKEELAKREKRADEEDQFSASTAWKYYNYVSAYLNYLKEWEHIDTNPARTGTAKSEMPDKPSPDSSEQQFWQPEQRSTLMKHVNERAHHAIDEHGTSREAYVPVRDRVFCAVIGFSGVRGSEVLNQRLDDQPGRNGATWADLHLEERRLDVLGKSQDAEDVPLTSKPVEPLRRWKQLLEPPSEDWPLFPSLHFPTLWGALRDELEARGNDEEEIEATLEDYSRPLLACADLDVRPPAMTTDGGRSLMRRLTDAAGVDVSDDEKEYLTLHGGRRGAGEQYRRNDSLDSAQKALRHNDPRVTEQMYSHVEAEDVSEIGDQVFEDE